MRHNDVFGWPLWWSLLLGMALWSACGTAQSAELLDVSELEQLLQDDPAVQLIDVRTPEEYSAGHLEGAVNIDYQSEDFEARLAAVDRNRTTVLYCARGGRSHQAYVLGEPLKFKKLYDLNGGYSAWMARESAAQ